jgi:LPXTG-site transpeptidase (sortase) family protein
MRAVGAVRGTLFAVAVASLGSAGFIVLDARLFDARERQRVREWSAGGPRAPGPLASLASRRLAEAGESWGRLEALRRAVGHVPGTAFPGEAGNVVLAGHRDMHFRPLHDARRGDLLRLVTPDGTFVYRVDDLEVVDPGHTEVMQSTAVPQLTLITCYPFSYVGPAPQRFVVRASLLQRL